jgi:organic radical activating enzyme
VHDERFQTSFDKPAGLEKMTIFTGRVVPRQKKDLIRSDNLRIQLAVGKNKLVIISVGGGMDGSQIITKVIDIKPRLKYKTMYLITTGPCIKPAFFNMIREKTLKQKDILITRFNPNFLDYLNASDLSISMGGYNTINNILLTGVNAIVYPRTTDDEQLIRAKRFKDYLKIGKYKVTDSLEKEIDEKFLKDNMDLMLGSQGKDVKNKADKRYTKKLYGSYNTARFLSLVSKINQIKIRLTTKCNLGCEMCYWKDKESSLDLDTVNRILDDCKILGIPTVNFTGGEPTIYKDIIKVLKKTQKCGLKISFSTNGVMTKARLKRIEPLVDYFDISIDSNDKIIHDGIRGKGSFDTSQYSIRYLSKMNKKPHINVTVRPDNYLNISKIIDSQHRYIWYLIKIIFQELQGCKSKVL